MNTGTIVREKIQEHYQTDGTLTREVTTIVLGNPKHDRNFIKMYPAFFASALNDVSTGALKLFIWFVSEVIDMKPNQEPLVLADLKEMAKAMKITPRSVQNHLAQLLDKKWILRRRKSDGTIYPNAYTINPEYVYKGQQRIYFEQQAEDPR